MILIKEDDYSMALRLIRIAVPLNDLEAIRIDDQSYA
jgi:hypothetical protein